LKERFDLRRKGRADDDFTETAYGRILKAMGNKAAAFEVLADASFTAPDQAETLPELVREAEELRKFEAAIRLQEQLLRILPNAGADAWEKLAHLQERNLAVEAAALTWERIAAKFPRNPEALQKAADFEMRSGDPSRAIELLRRLRTLEPTNLRALTALGGLSLEAGEVAEARSCFEQILKLTTAEKAGEPLRFPGLRAEDAGRLQTSYLHTVRQRRAKPNVQAMRALRTFGSGLPLRPRMTWSCA
jgi:tetratricopeptide (TPR) repeat protein